MKNIRLKEFNSKMIKKYNKQLKLYLKIVIDENKILNNDEKLGKIIEIFEVGKISGNYIRNIVQGSIMDFEAANPHKILEVFYETIPEEYKGITQKRVDKSEHKVEVLLSEYLI